MRIAEIKIDNFRGIRSARLLMPGTAVLVGDNNTGKSTILEAVDLVLGPERLSRFPPIDEHDFYASQYLNADATPIEIRVEVVLVDLSEEQQRHFRNHLEWWDSSTNALIDGPPADRIQDPSVLHALRVRFVGKYDVEIDDFEGKTSFASPEQEEGESDPFRIYDKRLCGFLFLRTLRTGARALSLERGSLLDVILKLQEHSLRIWEAALSRLRGLDVEEAGQQGIGAVLASVQQSVREFVHADWADDPRLRISDLTRESLRRALTVFMATGATLAGGEQHSAPFQHQGTGTINTLVLALLSQIAELKQNVIFAMEEPEIAIPPHAQKRIIECIRQRSAQALFTSHSPYVIEEFDPSEVLVARRQTGVLEIIATTLPPAVKAKSYRAEVRTRFCEALLARRVLIVEGRTEYDAIPAAARRLQQLHPDEFRSLEAMGIAVIDAQTDSQVAALGTYFGRLGKQVFAVFDRQDDREAAQAVLAAIPDAVESPEKGFENVLLRGCAESALRRYGTQIVNEGDWPRHLAARTPAAGMPIEELKAALGEYLKWAKGAGDAAELVRICTRAELPTFLVQVLQDIRGRVEPVAPAQPNPGRE